MDMVIAPRRISLCPLSSQSQAQAESEEDAGILTVQDATTEIVCMTQEASAKVVSERERVDINEHKVDRVEYKPTESSTKSQSSNIAIGVTMGDGIQNGHAFSALLSQEVEKDVKDEEQVNAKSVKEEDTQDGMGMVESNETDNEHGRPKREQATATFSKIAEVSKIKYLFGIF